MLCGRRRETEVASQAVRSAEIGKRTVRNRWSGLTNGDLQTAELRRSDVHIGYEPRARPTVHWGTSLGPILVVLSTLTASGAMIARARHHSMRRDSPKHVRSENTLTRFSIHAINRSRRCRKRLRKSMVSGMCEFEILLLKSSPCGNIQFSPPIRTGAQMPCSTSQRRVSSASSR